MTRQFVDKVGGFDPQFMGREACDLDLGTRAFRANMVQVLVETVFVHTEASYAEAVVGESVRRYDETLFELKHGVLVHTIDDMKTKIGNQPWQGKRWFIPPGLNDRFAPNAPPLPVLVSPQDRILIIPDWEQQSWHSVFLELVSWLQSRPELGILVRVEPPVPL